MGNDAKCEQQVSVEAVDDVCDTPKRMDVATDHNLVGCNSAVLEPGKQDRTRLALDGTRWSPTDEGCWWNRTRWYTPKRVNKKWKTFSWGKRLWQCYGWHCDCYSKASKGYNDKRWHDSGRVAREQWRSGRPGNSMKGVTVCAHCKCNRCDLNEHGLTLHVMFEGCHGRESVV